MIRFVLQVKFETPLQVPDSRPSSRSNEELARVGNGLDHLPEVTKFDSEENISTRSIGADLDGNPPVINSEGSVFWINLEFLSH